MFDLIADTKLSAKEIAEILGTTPHAIYSQRSKCGIKVWKKPRKQPVKFPSSNGQDPINFIGNWFWLEIITHVFIVVAKQKLSIM